GNSKETELDFVAADERRVLDLLQQFGRAQALPRRTALRETFENPRFDTSVIDADRPGDGDGQSGEQGQAARARRVGATGKGERREQDRCCVRPALPVTHLAGMKSAKILRAESAT